MPLAKALPKCVLQSVGSETAQGPAGPLWGESCRIRVFEHADVLLFDVTLRNIRQLLQPVLRHQSSPLPLCRGLWRGQMSSGRWHFSSQCGTS